MAEHIHCLATTDAGSDVKSEVLACIIRESGIGSLPLGMYSTDEKSQLVMDRLNDWFTMELNDDVNYDEYRCFKMPPDDEVGVDK